MSYLDSSNQPQTEFEREMALYLEWEKGEHERNRKIIEEALRAQAAERRRHGYSPLMSPNLGMKMDAEEDEVDFGSPPDLIEPDGYDIDMNAELEDVDFGSPPSISEDSHLDSSKSGSTPSLADINAELEEVDFGSPPSPPSMNAELEDIDFGSPPRLHSGSRRSFIGIGESRSVSSPTLSAPLSETDALKILKAEGSPSPMSKQLELEMRGVENDEMEAENLESFLAGIGGLFSTPGVMEMVQACESTRIAIMRCQEERRKLLEILECEGEAIRTLRRCNESE